MVQITYGEIPQGAVVVGTCKPCESCGETMLLTDSQAHYRICAACAAALPDPYLDPLAD